MLARGPGEVFGGETFQIGSTIGIAIEGQNVILVTQVSGGSDCAGGAERLNFARIDQLDWAVGISVGGFDLIGHISGAEDGFATPAWRI